MSVSSALPPAPLQRARGQRVTSAAEVVDYLAACAARVPGATLQALGESAGGRPLCALALPALGPAPLRVLLIGSQHGAGEAAGTEALLALLAELVDGPLASVREGLALTIVADANPDGRDTDSNRNANGVNLNRDFVLLRQPESRALNRLLMADRPDVVLDLHESAAWKPRTLARHGWMTTFETQFDCANHAALPRVAAEFAAHVLLPRLIDGVRAHGRHAQRYLGEITSLEHRVTHGGVGARRLRNKAALAGALSFLLETRLDRRDGVYPSFRNIEDRTARQLQAVRVFLEVVAAARAEIATVLATARGSREAVVLGARYVPVAPAATVPIRLRSVASDEEREFALPDHRALAFGPALPPPRRYFITEHVAHFAGLLARHGLDAQPCPGARTVAAVRQTYVIDDGDGKPRWADESCAPVAVPAGALEVPLNAITARLAATLLEPRAPCSVFRYTAWRALIEPDRPFFIWRED